MTIETGTPGDWVPDACTLPTEEQPLRRGEFDDLFARDVLDVRRVSSQRVRLVLRPDPDVASRAAGLATKEAACCSFFFFDLAIADAEVAMDVSTAPGHEAVLTALAGRAEASARTGS